MLPRIKKFGLGVALAATAASAAACGGGSSGSSKNAISVVAYSTPQKAYNKLIPAFQATTAGKGSKFTTSFNASGAQERAVEGGQHADIVEFSLLTDMEKLVKAGIVDSSWNQNAHNGFVTDSVVTLVVKKGNPKGIHDWSDLVRPGIKVVTPNPLSSGSARWNLMAAYGSQIKEGKSPTEALDFVKQVLQHTVSQPDSGSQATAAFVGGTGDVLISYENEAISAQQANQPVDYVTPKDTILIQNPLAATKNAKNPTLAKAFVDFAYSDQGQKIFAGEGYRPVVKADFDANRFPTPSGLFTIDDLGGWDKVATDFFDPDNGSVTKIENDLGQ